MPIIRVGVVVLNQRSELLLRCTDDKWGLPGAEITEYNPIWDTAKRCVFEQSGVVAEPQRVLFNSEDINQDAHRHIIYIYVLASSELQQEELKPSDTSLPLWVDMRQLGSYQEHMTDEAVDALYKFSLMLKAQK